MEVSKQQIACGGIPDEVCELARDIDRCFYDYDTYGYWDDVEDTEEYIAEIANGIFSGEIWIEKALQEIINEKIDVDNCSERAKTLLCRLKEICNKKR